MIDLWGEKRKLGSSHIAKNPQMTVGLAKEHSSPTTIVIRVSARRGSLRFLASRSEEQGHRSKGLIVHKPSDFPVTLRLLGGVGALTPRPVVSPLRPVIDQTKLKIKTCEVQSNLGYKLV